MPDTPPETLQPSVGERTGRQWRNSEIQASGDALLERGEGRYSGSGAPNAPMDRASASTAFATSAAAAGSTSLWGRCPVAAAPLLRRSATALSAGAQVLVEEM